MLTKAHFLKGADISFVNEIEEGGGNFFEGDVETDVLEILKKSGVNSIRLRLWNNPLGGYNNLEKTIEMAKRIKKMGFHFLLNFHYSDYWADPGQQAKPKEWESLPFLKLVKEVETYTEEVIRSLKSEHALPDMVQIGNEIITGMLWGEGRVQGDYDNEKQWSNLSELIKAGMQGLQNALDEKEKVITMIHIDRGGDNTGSRKFFDKMEDYEIEFDIIGLSYYPWWHGTFNDLENNLTDLANRYGKDIVVVEVAYPWTMPTNTNQEFVFNSEDQLLKGYPATVDGQSRYLEDLMEIIKKTPNHHGTGIYYWEPCWIPSKEQWSVGHENNWANLTLFDFAGRKLKSLDVFK